MKPILYCVLFLFVAGDHDCGHQKVDSNLDIGSDIQLGEFPWLVQLHIKTNNGKILKNSCIGSLINKRYVLTSAVCAGQPGVPLKAIFGQHNITSEDCNDCPKQEIEIEDVITNEYIRKTHLNDIALIKLKEDVTFTDYVQPICLPFEEQASVGDKVVASGWGITKSGHVANLKKKVISTIITNEECQNTLKRVTVLADTHLCAERLNGNKDAICAGDSGGPLMFLKDGKWYQQGIVSFGIGCGEHYPDVNTNVGKYLNWISENIK